MKKISRYDLEESLKMAIRTMSDGELSRLAERALGVSATVASSDNEMNLVGSIFRVQAVEGQYKGHLGELSFCEAPNLFVAMNLAAPIPPQITDGLSHFKMLMLAKNSVQIFFENEDEILGFIRGIQVARKWFMYSHFRLSEVPLEMRSEFLTIFNSQQTDDLESVENF